MTSSPLSEYGMQQELRKNIEATLRKKINAFFQETQREMDEELVAKQEAERTAQEYRQAHQQTQQEVANLEKQLQTLDSEIEKLKSYILANGSSKFDPDQVLVPSLADPREIDLRHTLLAWDDVLYHLERGLLSGALPLQTVLTHARAVARAQFLCKVALARLQKQSQPKLH